jgi:hypothetical protein
LAWVSEALVLPTPIARLIHGRAFHLVSVYLVYIFISVYQQCHKTPVIALIMSNQPFTGDILKDLTKPLKEGKKKQSCRSNRIVFTLNNWSLDEYQQLTSTLTCFLSSKQLVYGIIGQEVGKNGTPHLQGFIHLDQSFLKSVGGTVSKWKSLLPALQRAHLESAYGSDVESQRYCSKEGTSVEFGTPCLKVKDVWTKIAEATSLSEVLELDAMTYVKCFSQVERIVSMNKMKMRSPPSVPSLRLWQSELLWRLMNQNDRQILFVVDRHGARGKSTFARYLRATYGEEVFYTAGGKSADIAFALSSQDKLNFESHVKYMIVDLPRQLTLQFAPWSIIEGVKNAMFFSGKYQSIQHILLEPLKVVVFTNHPVDDYRHMLTPDRWSVIDLDDEYAIKGAALDVLVDQGDPHLERTDATQLEDFISDEELAQLLQFDNPEIM